MGKTEILAIAWFCLLVGCTSKAAAPKVAIDAPLRAELLRRVARDQAMRDTVMAGMRERAGSADSAAEARMSVVDADNTAWLLGVVGTGGWVTRARVGSDGADAAFLLLQHADSAVQRRMLPRIQSSYAAGEFSGQNFALVSDRVATHQGRPQSFGTQAMIKDGQVAFFPIADSAGVDDRRAKIGLMPLREYKAILDSGYIGASSR